MSELMKLIIQLRKDSPVPKFRQQLEEALGGIPIPRFTLSLMLQPGMKVRVRVGFLPKDYELRSSLLLIRLVVQCFPPFFIL